MMRGSDFRYFRYFRYVFLWSVVAISQHVSGWSSNAFAPRGTFATTTSTTSSTSSYNRGRWSIIIQAQAQQEEEGGSGEPSDPTETMNPFTKASWYAVELFGKTFGSSATQDDPSLSYSGPPKSIPETLKRIQLDNDRSYFLSGEVDKEIYDPECVFADPFVSFAGRDRFVTNLANLGSFITNYKAKVLTYDQPNPTTIETKIMVKLELNLPWKPILAWPWGVTYTVDPLTNLIVDHTESWDIAPLEGVKQIFRKPTLSI